MAKTDPQAEHRQHLVLAGKDAQRDYDRTVLWLSGGAFALSLAFVDDLVGQPPFERPGLLLAAWLCWGVSVLAMLVSFWSSGVALRRAIAQLDAEESNAGVTPGGRAAQLTACLNVLGGGAFLAGAAAIVVFAWPVVRG